MTEKKASELLAENLSAIYGYAYTRLYDKDKAEELAADIVYEIITSAHNLKNETAFWGYAWRIAENTLRRFLRKTAIITVEWTDVNAGSYAISPEEEFIRKEEEADTLYLLRRELSLLKKLHREICIAYYIDGKKCSHIAFEQKISVEMVKYYLFQTRKTLKEGIGMVRTLGEKSYNPGTFRLDFVGDRNLYGNLFQRKLPGSIVLAAYTNPMTAEALSVELGVSMPYLEEELEILEAAGVLQKAGERYQTNIVILTDAYETEFIEQTADVYDKIALDVFETAKSLLPQLRVLAFHGSDYDDNRLMFAILNLVFMRAYDFARQKSPLGKQNQLPLGSHGWIYGYDNDYIHCHFYGITQETWNAAGTAWFSAENYRILERAQLYDHYDFQNKTEAMCDAILQKEANRENPTLPWLISERFIHCENNQLSANFIVFSSSEFRKVCDILSKCIETVADCMITISDKAEKMLLKVVPAHLRSQCKDIAKIHHRIDVAAFLLETLIRENKLTVPEEKTPLCVWGVDNTKE